MKSNFQTRAKEKPRSRVSDRNRIATFAATRVKPAYHRGVTRIIRKPPQLRRQSDPQEGDSGFAWNSTTQEFIESA